VRRGCSIGPVDSMISVRGPFRVACADSDPCLPTEDVTKRGKGLTQRRMGRCSHFSLLSAFILLFIIPSQGFRIRGSVLPPHPCHRPGGGQGASPRPPCLQLFDVATVGLLSHHILR
jgi:hypothetical protein